MGSEAGGWTFPTLSFHVLGESIWGMFYAVFQMGPRWGGAQVSLVAPSSVMHLWVGFLSSVSPIRSHGVGDVQKCTQVFPIGAFKLPTSPHILHRSGGQASRKDWSLDWATYSVVFTYFLHLTVGRIQEASCCPIWQTATSRHNVSIRFRNSCQVGSRWPRSENWQNPQKSVPRWFSLLMRASEFLLLRIFSCCLWASLEEPERMWPVTHLL